MTAYVASDAEYVGSIKSRIVSIGRPNQGNGTLSCCDTLTANFCIDHSNAQRIGVADAVIAQNLLHGTIRTGCIGTKHCQLLPIAKQSGGFLIEEHRPESLEDLGAYLVQQIMSKTDESVEDRFEALRLLLRGVCEAVGQFTARARPRASGCPDRLPRDRPGDHATRAEIPGADGRRAERGYSDRRCADSSIGQVNCQLTASLTDFPTRLNIPTSVSIVNFATFLFTTSETRGRDTIMILAASACFN